jgi:hypothetical protein
VLSYSLLRLKAEGWMSWIWDLEMKKGEVDFWLSLGYLALNLK